MRFTLQTLINDIWGDSDEEMEGFAVEQTIHFTESFQWSHVDVKPGGISIAQYPLCVQKSF